MHLHHTCFLLILPSLGPLWIVWSNKSPSDLFELLDLKGLNFTKNQLFSREIRRLCRFANYPFKGDLYLEVEKALNYINSHK